MADPGFKFEIPNCPKCGKNAHEVTEKCLHVARLFEPDEHGRQDYDGIGTRIVWDSQAPDVDRLGRVEVQCEEGHLWRTHFKCEEDSE